MKKNRLFARIFFVSIFILALFAAPQVSNADNACTANLSNDLTLSVPIVTYAGQAYWADFQYVPNTMDFAVTNIGVVDDLSQFSTCSAATLSPSLQLQIPAVIFNGVSYWADFQYDQGVNFTLTGAGITVAPGGVTVNVQTALTSIGTNGLNQNFTISGTYSTYQATGQGNETVTPATATTLNGTSVLLETSTFSGTIVVKNRSVTISETDMAYLNPTNYDFIAGADSANSSYSGSEAYYTTYATVAYPTTVQAGASGLVATTKLYSDPVMATQIGTGTLSYSVAADGSSTSTLLVTFVQDQYDMSNTHTLEKTVTYRVDTSGNGSLVSADGINYGGDANSTAGATGYNITFTYQ